MKKQIAIAKEIKRARGFGRLKTCASHFLITSSYVLKDSCLLRIHWKNFTVILGCSIATETLLTLCQEFELARTEKRLS